MRDVVPICSPPSAGRVRIDKRGAAPDEVGIVGALLMGLDGDFITGSDFLMDRGVKAAYWYRELVTK